jgi:hypothetical protein
VRRSTRANPRSAVARSKQTSRRHVYAPRPGSVRPATRSPSTAAKRTSSRWGARLPQPAQRLTGLAALALVRSLLLGRRSLGGNDGGREPRGVVADELGLVGGRVVRADRLELGDLLLRRDLG